MGEREIEFFDGFLDFFFVMLLYLLIGVYGLEEEVRMSGIGFIIELYLSVLEFYYFEGYLFLFLDFNIVFRFGFKVIRCLNFKIIVNNYFRIFFFR